MNITYTIPSTIFATYSHIILFDCETTGLDVKNDRIIELAALKITPLGVSDKMDSFVAITDETPLPDIVTNLTGLNREYLQKYGVTEEEVMNQFLKFIETDGKTLFVAHNAQFDVSFLLEMVKRNNNALSKNWDVIDTLTVFKDRAAYPHKLSDALKHYKVEEIQNTHLAGDDVQALYAVFSCMSEECNDLWQYINIFGVHRNGLNGERIPGIRYYLQEYHRSKKLLELIKDGRAAY